jgi:hypothetical protein
MSLVLKVQLSCSLLVSAKGLRQTGPGKIQLLVVEALLKVEQLLCSFSEHLSLRHTTGEHSSDGTAQTEQVLCSLSEPMRLRGNWTGLCILAAAALAACHQMQMPQRLSFKGPSRNSE